MYDQTLILNEQLEVDPVLLEEQGLVRLPLLFLHELPSLPHTALLCRNVGRPTLND